MTGCTHAAETIQNMKARFQFCLALTLLTIVPSLRATEWTIAVYMNGDNNLEGDAIDDFLEMASVGSTADVKIVTLLDRRSGYATSYDNWQDTRRGLITFGDVPDSSWGEGMGELNMGAPATLTDFIDWAATTYPSERLAVVVWDHGDGWKSRTATGRAISGDDTNGDDWLYTDELQQAFTNATADVDLIGFDACLMGMIEVAYEIRNLAAVMVASPANEPLDGWAYDDFLGQLVATPTMTSATLGTVIVDTYYASYGNDYTQAALDLTAVGALASAMDSLGTVLIDNWDGDRQPITAAAAAVQTALDTAVIHERHGGDWPGASGLAVYFPSGTPDKIYDTQTDFGAETGWYDFLTEYAAVMRYDWVGEVRSNTQAYDETDHRDIGDFASELINRSFQIITASPLPAATVGIPHSTTVAASGGIEPYNWTVTGGYAEDEVEAAWVGGGNAQGWRGDDECWTLTLPWSFPFYGSNYNSVYVCSNGYLDFANSSADYSNSVAGLAANARIAPLWDDLLTNNVGGDIYVTSTADFVSVRWVGQIFNWTGDGAPVDFEVVLYPDGRIAFNYGINHTGLTATVGISAGTDTDYILSSLSGATSIASGTSREIVVVPAALPPGLSLTPATGEISGTPTAAGDYVFGISVTDSVPNEESRIFTLTVQPANQGECSYSLVAGYSLLAVPFTDTGLDDAAALLAWLPNGQGAWRWNAASQAWLSYTAGLGGTNFAIAAGDAVLVNCDPGTANVAGTWPESLSFALATGYNLVSVPDGLSGMGTASDLLAAIPNATAVWSWDGANQAWQAWIGGFGGSDFPVEAGTPFLVSVTAPTTWPAVE